MLLWRQPDRYPKGVPRLVIKARDCGAGPVQLGRPLSAKPLKQNTARGRGVEAREAREAREAADRTIRLAPLVEQVFDDVPQGAGNTVANVLQRPGVQPSELVRRPARQFAIAGSVHRHAAMLERLQDVAGHQHLVETGPRRDSVEHALVIGLQRRI